MPQAPVVPPRPAAPDAQPAPPAAGQEVKRTWAPPMYAGMRRPSMGAMYGYSARQQLSGANMAWPYAPVDDVRRQSIGPYDPRLQQSGGAVDSRRWSVGGPPPWQDDDQAAVPWGELDQPFDYDRPLNLERKEESTQEKSKYKKKFMAGMVVVLCLSVVAALFLLQGKETAVYAGQKTEAAAEVSTTPAVKVLVKVTPPASKPSVGLTCISETLSKLATSAYNDMCSRLYVKLHIDEDGFFDPVPASMKEITIVHPKTVGYAISLRGTEDYSVIFAAAKKNENWLKMGCALLDVPFRKVFATNVVKDFLAIVSHNIQKEMVMISIEPDDYISKFKDNIQSSRLSGVHIIVVGTRQGRFSCPTEGLWKQQESLDLAILLNKKLPQPISIGTTAAVAELQFVSGRGGACKSVTKVTEELQGCNGLSTQKKFLCGPKIYYAETDSTMKAMASYAKKNGLNCALLDSEVGQLAAKYVMRNMANLNCNSTGTSGLGDFADNDDA